MTNRQRDRILEDLKTITPKDMKPFYRHCKYCGKIVKCRKPTRVAICGDCKPALDLPMEIIERRTKI